MSDLSVVLDVARSRAVARTEDISQRTLTAWAALVVIGPVSLLIVFVDPLAEAMGNRLSATLALIAVVSTVTVAFGWLAVGLTAINVTAVAIGATLAVPLAQALHDHYVPTAAASNELIKDIATVSASLSLAECQTTPDTEYAAVVEAMSCKNPAGDQTHGLFIRFNSLTAMNDAFRERRVDRHWAQGTWWHGERETIVGWFARKHGTSSEVLLVTDHRADKLILMVLTSTAPHRGLLDLSYAVWGSDAT